VFRQLEKDNYLEKYRDWLERANSLHHDFVAQENETIAWSRLTQPLSECRVALVTTSGVHLRDQEPFNAQALDGDPSYRVIPESVDAQELIVTHNHYDHSDADRDVNCLFPIDRLRELVTEGTLGAASREHFGFMGFNPRPDRIVKNGNDVADRLVDLGVDVAVLSPG
jgi:D-proline reductase (dithiol) PrdB